MRIILNIVFAGILLLLPALARAADAGAPPDAAVETSLDAPSPPLSLEHGKAFTGDATTLEPGRVEVEIAYAPSWWATAGAVDRLSGEQHQVAASLSVGIVPDLDGRIVVGWALVRAAPPAPGAPSSGNGSPTPPWPCGSGSCPYPTRPWTWP